MRRAVAAALIAAVLPLTAAKCDTSGGSDLPVKYKYAWLTELPASDYIVFSPGQPDGDWELKGYVRGQPNVRVWVRRRP